MVAAEFLSHAWNVVLAIVTGAQATIVRMLFWSGSSYSLVALGITLGIAAAVTLGRRRAKRSVPWRVLRRALLPRRLWRSASGKTDAVFAGFNILVGPLLFGWAIIGQTAVATWTQQALTQAFGTSARLTLPLTAAAAITSVLIFIAYEMAYWLDHYLSHKLPFLWRFHAVHHSAESLSLATNFRVHPVDTIVFYNIVAVAMGIVAGLCSVTLGTSLATAAGLNLVVLASAVLVTHLHHSHLWITYGRRWGRILLSPAHHQLHHSSDPAHYDCNFGNSLAVLDRLFGTHHAPAARRPVLQFGVSDIAYRPHSFVRSIAMPFHSAIRMMWPAERPAPSTSSDDFLYPAPNGS